MKDILIDDRGRPNTAGRKLLLELCDSIRKVFDAHHADNTGMPCRVDLDGHDCCWTCNAVEAVARAYAIERGILGSG